MNIRANVKKCQIENCSFFKTKAQAEEDQKKALKRIKSLDPPVKRSIMELYYGGKMSLLDEMEVG
jgi:methylphosphotriester-DNA--protein-cysteine methyltransferase